MAPLMMVFCCLGVLCGIVYWVERRLSNVEDAVANFLRELVRAEKVIDLNTLQGVVEDLARKQAKEKETRAKFDEESG